MNIYLLKRLRAPNWDETAAVVVRAPSEDAARRLIAATGFEAAYGAEGREPWLNRSLSGCALLAEDVPGVAAIVCRDFRAG